MPDLWLVAYAQNQGFSAFLITRIGDRFFLFSADIFSAKMLFASSAALGFSNQNSQYRIAIDT
ncbi:hypothetical protein WMO25_18270 [Coprococcus sp. CLA-AA-H190]|uniref:Uncharacterized protein n=1 Tax=Coprococcus intestinihominis TaxID=3133154 RepID=A0ABV1BBS9_9FIRM